MKSTDQEFGNWLKETPHAIQFATEKAIDGLAYFNIGDETFLQGNKHFWSLLDYSPKQAVKANLRWEELIHPDDRKEERQVLRIHLDSEGREPYEIMLRLLKRTGGSVWMRVRGQYLPEQGKHLFLSFTELNDLKRKEAFLQHSSEMARIGFYDWDIKAKQLYWSQVTREIHGVDSEFEPDYRQAIKFYKEGRSQHKITELVDRALHYGQPFDEELQIVNQEGSDCWVRVIGIPELQDGRAVRLYGLFQDIDKQLRSENAIRSERELYRQVLQGANVGAWDWDIDSDNITLNRKAAELLGYDLEVMRREGQVYWFDLLHPNDKERVIQELNEYVVGALAEFNVEARLKKADDNYRWLSINGKLFQPDAHFARPRVVGIWKDIHYEKERLSYHSTFIQEAPLAIAMFDRKMRYINCSHKWRTDYGLEETAIIGESHYDIFPEISEEWKAFHKRCLKGETLRKQEDVFYRLDGRKQWIRWEIRPWLEGNNQIGGIIMYTEDLTKQKEDEEALNRIQRAFSENFKNSAIGMAIISPEGAWVEVNDKICQMLGYSRKELSTKTFQELTHPEDLDKDLVQFEALRKGEIPNYQMEKRYLRKDGSILRALLAAAAVRNEQAEVEYYVSQVIGLDSLP